MKRAPTGTGEAAIRSQRIVPVLAAVAAFAGMLSCDSSAAMSNAGDDGAVSACGTPSANSRCETTTWPRLVIAFADPSAAAFGYSLRDGTGSLQSERNQCPSGSSLDCDLGFYGYPSEKLDVTILVTVDDGGTVLTTRDVLLKPFNYCGVGVAQVVASTDDAGMPQLSAVDYANACGSL